MDEKVAELDRITRPHVSVVILNWNGWQDTVECLESLAASTYEEFSILVVDNGSTDGSFDRLRRWAMLKMPGSEQLLPKAADLSRIKLFEWAAPCSSKGTPRSGPSRLVLIGSDENLGFAKGSNLGMRWALAMNAEYIWLLNNDTTVAPEALQLLVDFLETQTGYAGVTGEIRYYHEPDRIWNCGGRLTWYGNRKYYGCNQKVANFSTRSWLPISFATGCALLLRASLIREVGYLTERFFFGEEDIEFCRRLRKVGKRLACHRGAVIYHKVGQSTRNHSVTAPLGRIYIHYLNRFIHQRDEWPRSLWNLWRLGSAIYILPMLHHRYGLAYGQLVRMYRQLLRDSTALNEVDQTTFERIMAIPPIIFHEP